MDRLVSSQKKVNVVGFALGKPTFGIRCSFFKSSSADSGRNKINLKQIYALDIKR